MDVPDPLKIVEVEQWSLLQSRLKTDWPRSISGYYLLETQKDWKGRGVDYGCTIYCPYGDIENGTVAINIKKELYEIIVFCPKDDDTKKLEEALLRTRLVDWSKRVVVPFAPRNAVECVSRLLHRIGTSFESTLTSDAFILHRGSKTFELRIPTDFYIDLLQQKHVAQIDSSWPHRYPTSTWYFSTIIQAGTGYGVFLNDDHSLVSWLFVNEVGTLGHLYTEEKYRKSGLAELLLKHVSNIILGNGKDVFAFCVKGNFKGCSLYMKIGFEKFEDVTWCYIKPRI